MIPDWHLTTLWIGPVPIQVWGLFVALGFALAIILAVRRAPRFGINPVDVVDFSAWAIVAAFLGARLFHVLIYEYAYYLAHLDEIVRVWEGGLSSSGGFIGAAIAGVWFVHRRRIRLIAFADCIVGALPLGYAVGRLGCHFTRMHPGPTCSGGAFCFRFPDGALRLEMASLEIVLWIAIALAVAAFRKRLAGDGRVTALVIGWYGVGRFALDFLRVGDATYFGLTPAQYLSAVLTLIGIALFVRARKK